MTDQRLLLKVCSLPRADREWILSILPEDVRQSLLFKLAHFVGCDVNQDAVASNEFLRSMEIVRWSEFLAGIRSDCIKKGNPFPEKLIEFIRQKYCK